jgi:PAS domain S-box-containing protein
MGNTTEHRRGDPTQATEVERLRDSEQRYRELFEAVSDGFWEIDPKGRFTYISPGYEAAFGISIPDMLGKRLNDLPGVTMAPEMAQKALAAIKARQPFRDFIHSLQPGAKKLWIHASWIPFFDRDGAFQGYRGVSRDITAQIEAEQALRDSEQRFKQLCETAYDYFWETDADGRVTFVSPNFEAIFGIAIAQLRGGRITDVPGFRMDPEMGRAVAMAVMARQPYRDLVFSVKWPNGPEHWVRVSAMPVFEGGEFRGYRGVGSDVTAHRMAEETARLAEGRLHDAVARVRQPFVLYDAEDRVLAFNQAFADLHREPSDRIVVENGVLFRDIAARRLESNFYAAGPEDEAVDLETLLARQRGEGEHIDHLGDGRWMLVDHRRLPGGGSLDLWTDITAVKRADADRRMLEGQLHHAQRLESLGTLAGGVAHEINNALVPVVALTKMVAAKLPDGSRDRRNLDTVVGAAERSRDLVKQILAFSRKDEAGQRLESVDVTAVLRDALRLMRATVPTSIRLKEEIAAAPPIAADAKQLHQVIVNLVTNAAQAIGEVHGTITIGLSADPDRALLRLWVADTGGGMDEATRKRIFEPFFTTKDVGKGTGLGLSVVHGIVKDHGGTIEVESAPGRGSRFDILLPLDPARAGVVA